MKLGLQTEKRIILLETYFIEVLSISSAKQFKSYTTKSPSTNENNKRCQVFHIYSFAVGNLMYVMICTESNITHPADTVNKFIPALERNIEM